MLKKLKKMLYALPITLLSSGAALTLGLLSFGGMYALWPIWPLAAASFALSSAYEWEIYFQNIRNALNKLFLHQNYLQEQLGKPFLKAHCPTDTPTDEPQFFKAYKDLLNNLHNEEHAPSNEEDALNEINPKNRIKKLKKDLFDLETNFYQQLFNLSPSHENNSDLDAWLNQYLAQERAAIQTAFLQRRRLYRIAAAFSLFFSSVFMGAGTVYLLSETLSILPFLGAVPFLASPLFIVPLAIIAGAAYGLLTFNAITDMINNNTIKKMVAQYQKPWKEIFTLKTIGTTFLIALALALTVCTAGTWWTVAKQVKPIVNGLAQLPKFMMGFINPIISGLSALAFNWQNTVETLSLLEAGHDHGHHHDENPADHLSFSEKIRKHWRAFRQDKNWGQILNPFRGLLLLIIPLRIVFFLGHLVSIGVTGDRMPKIPQTLSALFGIISEGFEDWHYFFGHHHHHPHNHNHSHEKPVTTDVRHLLDMHLSENEHGHHHDLDLPTQCIKFVFIPVYLLAMMWNWSAKKLFGAPTPPAATEKEIVSPIIMTAQCNRTPKISPISSDTPCPIEHYGQGMRLFDQGKQLPPPANNNIPTSENTDTLVIVLST